jgi:hypothetical protein
MDSLTIGRRGRSVFLANNITKTGIQMDDYHNALQFAWVMRMKARHLYGPEPEEIFPTVDIRRSDEDDAIIVGVRGSTFAVIPCGLALEMSNAITERAKFIEEEVEWEQVMRDQALLMRNGSFPLRIARSPDVLKEAALEAQSSRDLRRALPHPSWPTLFGVATVTKGRTNGEKEHING